MHWYQKSHFRNLVDMHIPSGIGNLENFDAQRYACLMEKAGVDEAYVYASNCLGLCLYPSKVGYRHSITEKRDLFGETVAALRKKGIGVVGYLNSWSTEAALMHPDWRVREMGKPEEPVGRFGVCCLNSPYRDYFLALVEEMVSTYDMDGLWVDMIGFYTSACTCEHCRKRYREATGFEIPETVDWTDENYLRYLRFKCDTVSSYARQIAETARKARPGISVSLQCAYWKNPLYNGMDDAYFAAMDYVSGDFYGDKDWCDVVCRVLYSLTQNKPFEYMISRAPDLNWHTCVKKDSEILLQACTSLLCGGSFLFIDAIDPDGGMNEKLYEKMGALKKRMEPFFAHADCEDEMLRDVAVYINFDSFMSRDSNGKPSSALLEYGNGMAQRLPWINQALMHAHIDYAVLTHKNLDELNQYKVLVLPSLERMSQEECERIRCYVKDGGTVYASGLSSSLSTDGAVADRFMLADVFGAEFEKFVDRKPVYISPVKEMEPLFAPFTFRYPPMVQECIPVVSAAAGAEVAGTITYPFTDERNGERFSSAISNPPAEYTQLPGLIFNSYGKGCCCYSAAQLESCQEFSAREIFARIVEKLAEKNGGLTFSTEEGEHLEHVLKRRHSGNGYKISLLNNQSIDRPVPMRDVAFTLRMEQTPVRVYSVSGTPVTWTRKDDRIHFLLSELPLYDEILLELS